MLKISLNFLQLFFQRLIFSQHLRVFDLIKLTLTLPVVFIKFVISQMMDPLFLGGGLPNPWDQIHARNALVIQILVALIVL